MNIKKEILELIKKSLVKLNFSDDSLEVNLERPQDLANGDFTSNIALILGGKSGKNPREFAEQIRAQIPTNENIEKIEIAGPGYLNFYLSKDFFYNFLRNGLSLEREKQEKKILFEHSSPNLFKPFHIGHMVNNSIGESLSRILEFSGYSLKRISFPSDVSPGIAKTIWALKKSEKDIQALSLQEIAEGYVEGTKAYKESEEAKKEIDLINIDIYHYLNKKEVSDQKNIDFYLKGKELSLEHFKEITQKLGSKFDQIFFESEAEKVGKKIVRENIGKVFKKSEGAVVFEGSEFTNVFINSAGFGTYLAKDIGLLKLKEEKFPQAFKSFVVTDVEQKQHFQMIKEAGTKISEISDFVQKSEYLQHGRMNFSGKIKISSRYGNVPLAVEVIDKVKENILEKMKERDFSDDEKKTIAEKLAIATLKYSILKVTSGKNISFDIENDTNPQGNTGSFLLYARVRALSVLKKAEELERAEEEGEIQKDIPEILRKITFFDEILDKVLEEYSPHSLVNYLYDLAKEFNKFYAENKILDNDNKDLVFDLEILKLFEEIMKKGLELLAIETVDRM